MTIIKLQLFNDLMTNDLMTNKKHTLKPGKHQFAPNSPAIHHNDNLTDAEAEWYIQKYPHIQSLFTTHLPEREVHLSQAEPMNTETNPSEHLTPPSGGQGGA